MIVRVCECRACQSISAVTISSSISEADAWKNPILTPLESLTLYSTIPTVASATSISGLIVTKQNAVETPKMQDLFHITDCRFPITRECEVF